jgi:hypothetical protein
MEQRTLKSVNNCLNNNFYSYLETSSAQSSNLYLNDVHLEISGGQSFNLYLNVVHIFNTSVNLTSVEA